jgi:hypothetical protein
MSKQTCEDCGCPMYDGCCVNCDEEVFIEAQYHELGESAPAVIAEKAAEQKALRAPDGRTRG